MQPRAATPFPSMSWAYCRKRKGYKNTLRVREGWREEREDRREKEEIFTLKRVFTKAILTKSERGIQLKSFSSVSKIDFAIASLSLQVEEL